MSYKLVVIIVFLLSYIGIVARSRKKSYFAGAGALVLVIVHGIVNRGGLSGIFTFIIGSVNWNVLGIFLGTLLIAEAFIESNVPALIAHFLVSRARTVGMAVLYVCIMTSFLSAFIENVATVLIVAPIALEIAKKEKISPVTFLIGLAVSANLQGTATLIGDPPSMILAGYMGYNFNQFFIFEGKLGIFFAVQVGAIISFFVLALFFRQYKAPVSSSVRPDVQSLFPTVVVLLMIVLLALSSFIDPEFSSLGGIICMVLGIMSAVWFTVNGRYNAREVIRRIDFDTIIFLSSIFILVGSLTEARLMQDMASLVLRLIGSNTFMVYTFLVWFSVLVSGFVDNVPYITAMIPVTKIIATNLGLPPHLFIFGLLIGACLGGNITHVGASANIVSVSILKREGYLIGLKEFSKIGLPFTIAATVGSYIFVWLLWGG